MKKVRLAWGITGAGHFLQDSFELMSSIKKELNADMTIFISRAGREVIRMYGLLDTLLELADGSHFNESFFEEDQGASFPKAARLSIGEYDALIVSPTTTNTVAKILQGIADTLVSVCVSHAMKGDVPVIIVPTDPYKGVIETTLAITTNSLLCESCDPCPVVEICPEEAAFLREGKISVDLLKCIGCKKCVEACPYNAIKWGEKAKIKTRKIDVDNIKKLSEIEGISVLDSPFKIKEVLKEIVNSP
ncbi:MAG: dihydromethanopterin reductase (acceptor) [Candidatus Hodarchaeota archaeon]